MNDQNTSMEENELQFNYSYGYDCQKWYNLCACDKNTIAWASGSMITFYNIQENQRTFRCSSTGGSIGHIIKNPSESFQHVTIAEGGFLDASPVIIIYDWPSMDILHTLQGGTNHNYSVLDYNADGSLLASIGSFPDYNLTIWDWKNDCVKLCANAYSFTVNNVKFSTYIHDQLVTCGFNHIKFWKMSETFTGLKLNSLIGRFGKTDISDILGILSMPDEKILSGCSWGNILVWDAGTIKLEVSRKGRKSCHRAPITQMMRNDDLDEVISIGLDGHICTWNWNIVEQAMLKDNQPYVELNPITEKFISGVKLVNLVHREDNEWFAQDASGGIWIVNLDVDNENTDAEELESSHARKIIHSHGGSVVGIALFVNEPYLITLGSDGSLLLHTIKNGQPIPLCIYPEAASCLLYLTKYLDTLENIFVLGFENGTIRIINLDLKLLKNHENKSSVQSLEILKPHCMSITAISINKAINVMLTSSLDSTIFLYDIEIVNQLPKLTPLYFIETPNVVNSICWNPKNDDAVLLAGQGNFILEGSLPILEERPDPNQIVSYKKDFINARIITLKDYKIYITSDEDLENITNTSKSIMYSDDDKMNAVLITENDESMDKSIIWAKYDRNDVSQIWISQENCNCLLRISPGENVPNAYALLCGDVETTITSQIDLNDNKQILGMSNGELLIVETSTIIADNCIKLNPTELRNKEKIIKSQTKNQHLKIVPISKIFFKCFFRISIHNCISGKINHLLLSSDEKIIFSAGGDGNVFSYMLQNSSTSVINYKSEIIPIDVEVNIEKKLDDCLTHEESIQDKERKHAEQTASNQRKKIEEELANLRIEFDKLLNMNENLPIKQRIEINEDSRVQEFILSNFNQQMDLVYRRLAYPLEVSNLRLRKMMKRFIEPLDIFPFQVNSILYSNNVKIIRQKKLPESFFTDLEMIKKKISESQNIIEQFQSPDYSSESAENESTENQLIAKSSEPEYHSRLLEDLPSSPNPPRPLAKAIQDYVQRLEKQHSQEKEWQDHLSKYVDYKLDNTTDDEMPIEEFSNKRHSNGDINGNSKIQSQLCIYNTRKEIFDIQHEFNKSVIELREQKKLLVQKLNALGVKLNKIAKELPEKYVKPCPFPIPSIDEDVEFAENNLNVTKPIIDLYDSKKNDSNLQSHEDGEEFVTRRIMLLKIEQDLIINDIKNSVNNWEKKFKCLCRKRERILLRAQFLKLHLLHLLQEQVILEPYEAKENEICLDLRNVESKVKECQDEISNCKKNIDAKKSPILGLKEQLKHIDQHFQILIENDQHAAFLKRVFKKKQKIQKDHSGSSLSSPSSSSSSDDSSKDVDDVSVKAGVKKFRLDSAVCPPGCDPEIYEKVLQSRSIRHELELKMKEEEDEIILIKKDIEIKNVHLKQLSEELQAKQSCFKDLIREKKSKLKDIETIVVLSSDQCMADAFEEMRKGGEALVFPGAGIHNLQERVKILLKEADEQKKRLSINKRHLKRMNADCNFMNAHINNLKDKIQHVLKQKLGIIDLNNKSDKLDDAKKKVSEILDAVLQNMTNQFKLTTASGLSTEMENQIAYWKKKQYSMEQQYCSVLQEHTSKLQTCASLEAELFSYKTTEREDSFLNDKEYTTDLVRLRRIRSEQQKQIDDLKAEVQRLKLKPHITTLLPPITPTNISLSPSVVSPPSFELTQSSGSRWIATSLAKELNLVETELMGSAKSSSTLMSTIAELFPILIEGKLDVNEAAEKIIETYHTKNGVDEKDFHQSFSASKAYRKSKQSIAEILSQITKQNLKLGDSENATIFDFDEIKIEPGTEVEYIIHELLQAGVLPDNSGAIDIAVAALVDIAPHLINQKIDVNHIVDSLKDKMNIDSETIRHMTIAVSICLSAQEIIPAENSLVAAECLEHLQRSLMDINSKSKIDKADNASTSKGK